MTAYILDAFTQTPFGGETPAVRIGGFAVMRP